MSTSDELKSLGNDCFVKGQYEKSVEYYTQAISTYGASAVLLTNKAAAYLALNMLELARADATKAIELDNSFTKAYYRKSTAEEKLGLEKLSYDTWVSCSINCEPSAWLSQQLAIAKKRWISVFKIIPIEDSSDFIARYTMLPSIREKLSTLAHLWNISTKEERLAHFYYFLQLIGGSTEIAPVYLDMTPDLMPDMPMQNYIDLPLESIPAWTTYFNALLSESKTDLLKQMYTSLDNYNQGLVIKDLGIFIQLAMSRATKSADKHSVEKAMGFEDDDDSVDGDTEKDKDPSLEQLTLTNGTEFNQDNH